MTERTKISTSAWALPLTRPQKIENGSRIRSSLGENSSVGVSSSATPVRCLETSSRNFLPVGVDVRTLERGGHPIGRLLERDPADGIVAGQNRLRDFDD